ncbi:MAG: hemerythrin domain-containing protein, partial [Bacteroidales bacterium]|nr:hemerythrin domain-containing protein [Bacteroidales bacterium]
IKDTLNDLTQIIFKYLPAKAFSNDAVDLVFDIFQISNDLEKHALIEEKILLPYIEYLEQNTAQAR